jgi:hypothetical protein
MSEEVGEAPQQVPLDEEQLEQITNALQEEYPYSLFSFVY